MHPSWDLIPRIVSGEKTIESRWYRTRRVPWNSISAGDTVYFKDAGTPVTAVATASAVLQFELETAEDARRIIARYGSGLHLAHPDPRTWTTQPRYCVLVFLKDARHVEEPFRINKAGFGANTAWLRLDNVADIMLPP